MTSKRDLGLLAVGAVTGASIATLFSLLRRRPKVKLSSVSGPTLEVLPSGTAEPAKEEEEKEVEELVVVPEQPASDETKEIAASVDARMAKAREQEAAITSALQGFAAKFGGNMEGLANRLKLRDSALRKLAKCVADNRRLHMGT